MVLDGRTARRHCALGRFCQSDADKTDLQIVPSARQCNLTWCGRGFFLQDDNVGETMEGRKDLKCHFGKKNTSWNTDRLHFSCAGNWFQCGNKEGSAVRHPPREFKYILLCLREVLWSLPLRTHFPKSNHPQIPASKTSFQSKCIHKPWR